MSSFRLLRMGVVSAALLVPPIAIAPLAQARPAQSAHAAKKLNCKLKKNKHKKQCRKHVGATTTNTTIGAPASVLINQRGHDATPMVIVGGTAASQAGSLTAVDYYANVPGEVRFLLLSAQGVVKATADATLAAAGRGSYKLATPWYVAVGDRLGLWQSSRPSIGYGQTSAGSPLTGKVPVATVAPALVGGAPTPPSFGSTVAVAQTRDLVYAFGGTLAPATKGPPMLSLPAPITVPLSAEKQGVVFAAGALDYNGNPVKVTCKPPSGAVFPLGTTTVACTATDAAGQTSTGSFPVTVTQ